MFDVPILLLKIRVFGGVRGLVLSFLCLLRLFAANKIRAGLCPSTLRSLATPVLRSSSATEDGEGGSVVKGHLVAFYRLCVLGALAVNDPGILPFKEKLVTKLVTNWLQTQKSPFSRVP